MLSDFLKIRPEINFSVSLTTRQPRKGELDGVNYYFVTDEKFDACIKKGDFLEWVEVHGNRYGTLKSTVHEVLAKGQTMILDTDTFGAFNIKKQFRDAVLIFILPPSPEILSKRLRNRNTESSDFVKKRLAAAPQEIARMADKVQPNGKRDGQIRRCHDLVKSSLIVIAVVVASWVLASAQIAKEGDKVMGF